MRPLSIQSENRVQAEAFGRMNGSVIDLIELYAADFRRIIRAYELAYHRIPSADDLIWIESQHRGRDITSN